MQAEKNPTKITRDFYNVGEAIHWSYCLWSHKECFPCSFKQVQYLQLHKTYKYLNNNNIKFQNL